MPQTLHVVYRTINISQHFLRIPVDHVAVFFQVSVNPLWAWKWPAESYKGWHPLRNQPLDYQTYCTGWCCGGHIRGGKAFAIYATFKLAMNDNKVTNWTRAFSLGRNVATKCTLFSWQCLEWWTLKVIFSSYKGFGLLYWGYSSWSGLCFSYDPCRGLCSSNEQ